MSKSTELTELLKQYKDLYDSNVLSKEEYEEKKASILAELSSIEKQSKDEPSSSKNKKNTIFIIGVIACLAAAAIGSITVTNYLMTKSSPKKLEKDEVVLGSYPQKRIYNTTTLKALGEMVGALPTEEDKKDWNSFNFIHKGTVKDLSLYKDLTYKKEKYRAICLLDYRNNSTLEESDSLIKYQQNNGYYKSVTSVNTYFVYYFKYEPIVWKTIFTNENKLTLISKYVLDSQEFNNKGFVIGDDSNYANNYKESGIRNWLNDKFYNFAFTEQDKAKINAKLVDNSLASTNQTSSDFVCENTLDYVSLLSKKDVSDAGEVLNGEKLMKSATEYAKAMGARVDNTYAPYWYRTPGSNQTLACTSPSVDGITNELPVHNTSVGVAPVIEYLK